MYKNFWYVLAASTDIKDKPKRIKALGQNYVCYRDEHQKPVVMSDHCIHRGGSLADGWVKDGCIRCPYHGWRFDSKGKCVEIPAQKNLKPPQRARVDSYPTQEKFGFIWAFLGDLPEEQRPPMPVFPGYTTDGFRAVYGQFEWDANFRRVVENSLDPAHASWVHRNSFGSNSNPEVDSFEVVRENWGAYAEMVILSPKLKGLWGNKREVINKVQIVNGYEMPNVTYVHMKFGNFTTRLFNIATPIDDEKTVTHWVIIRDFFKSRLLDRDTYRRTMKIFYEDGPIVARQRPELIPDELSSELHVESDGIQLAYRRHCKEVEERGWCIDSHQVKTLEGKLVTIVPSPERRQEPGSRHWVDREVPTLIRQGRQDGSHHITH